MIKNSIIPENIFYIKGNNAYEKPPFGEELDLKSITLFLASGFFFGNKTFFNDVKFLRSGEMFSNGKISKSKFNWYYEPRNISFNTAVCEFTDIFESIIKSTLKNSRRSWPTLKQAWDPPFSRFLIHRTMRGSSIIAKMKTVPTP